MITLTIITLLLLNFAQRNVIKKAIAKNNEAGRLQIETMGRRGCFITKKNRELVYNYLAETDNKAIVVKNEQPTQETIEYIEQQESEFPELYYIEFKVGRNVKQTEVHAKSFEGAKQLFAKYHSNIILRITKVVK